jgi:hypothetical protein
VSENIKKGQKVTWRWGIGHAEGTVIEVFHEKVSRTLKGAHITRNGSHENPALLIEQKDGDQVLKLTSEVEPL